MANTTEVVPETSKTAVIEGGKLVVKEVRTQVPDENEVLIKVAAIGLNPIDWKRLGLADSGSIAGCDFAGEIVKVGHNLDPDFELKIGDKVSASVRGNSSTKQGAFSQYAKTLSHLVWTIPDGTFSFDEAVTTGIPLNTAFQALYGPRTLDLTQPGAPDRDPPKADTWVFIYGGSSSVGQYAIQLAKLSGYKVATVASRRNHQRLTELGADLVIDYNDKEVVQKLKNGSGDKIHVALDTISKSDTQATSVRVLAKSEPGKVVVILPVQGEARKVREDVEVIHTIVTTAYGDTPTGIDEGNDEERNRLSAFLRETLPGLVKAGKLKPNRVNFRGEGLEKIQEGLAYLESGKASAEKVVLRP